MYNVAIFNDTSVTKHYGCISVMENLVHALQAHNMKVKFLWPVGADWRPQREELAKRLKGKIDAIIVNGEGTIHNSHTRERAISCSKVAEFSRTQLEIPAFLINSTIYNNSTETYDDIKKFSKIFVRDSASVKELATYGISSTYVPDLSVVSPMTDLPPNRRIQRFFTDSFDKSISIRLQEISSHVDGRFQSMKYRFDLRNLIQFDRVYDQIKSHRRKTRLSSFDEYEFTAKYKEWLAKLKASDFVVTGRYHSVTLCVLTGTPFVAVQSNTPKISNLLIDVFGTADRQVTLTDLEQNFDQIENRFGQYNDAEQSKIFDYLNFANSTNDKMIREIHSSIASEKRG